MNLPYSGALLPAEAYRLTQSLPDAKLVDVRTRAKLDWVGQVPSSVAVEWNSWPGGSRNLNFIAEFEASVGKDAIAMFLCRSGLRSHHAAIAVTRAGHTNAYNALQGFEGDNESERAAQPAGRMAFRRLALDAGLTPAAPSGYLRAAVPARAVRTD